MAYKSYCLYFSGPVAAGAGAADLDRKTANRKPVRPADSRKIRQLLHMAVSDFDSGKVGLSPKTSSVPLPPQIVNPDRDSSELDN